MSKHTPGPWTVQDDNCIYAGKVRIVETDSGYYPPRDADAHLIAAAPDMYKALIAARDYLDRLDNCTSVEIQIDAALAKAEGRS